MPDVSVSPGIGRRALFRSLASNRFDPRPTGLSVTRGSRVTSGSLTINGQAYSYNSPQYWWNSGAISPIGFTPTQGTHGSLAQGYGTDKHVNYGTIASPNYQGNLHRYRFRTAAPLIGIHTLGFGGSGIVLCVDGKWTGAPVDMPIDSAGNIALQLVDLGAWSTDQAIYSAAITAGGSGYAIGDTVTLSGGTGTAAVGWVSAVSAGAVTGIRWTNFGSYSAIPGSPVATTTGGSGTGLTVTPVWRPAPVIKDRIVELWCESYTRLAGISVGPDYTAQPVPAVGPRIAVLGDSQSEASFVDYAGGQWWAEMARAVGIDDMMSFAVGGQGIVAGNNYFGRIPDIIAAAPDIVWMTGSSNDAGQTDAAVRAAVATALQQLRAGLPNAMLITSSPWHSPGVPVVGSRNTAMQGGVSDANVGAKWVDTVPWTTNGRYIGGGSGTGSSSWKVGAGDGTHYSQQGHSENGALGAEALRGFLAAA